MKLKVKVLSLKEWSNDNLSTVSWTRIVLAAHSQLKPLGYSLIELNDPSDDYFFDDEALLIIEETCLELYKRNIPFVEFAFASSSV